ncbi:hypothetical protein Taro_026718 [Colocasia esculenta]|uniref:Endoplasmic reticulum transmembrane protein n=1 Tax=Colocasia esculenta TaxID=4460 RepID=A0A843VKF0_COLES|nr:hypothetical protein [Colocasia esculenta]
MIQLLFTVVGAEAGVVVLLLVKTPLRRLMLLALDHLKRGRGPVAVRTVAITVAVFLVSSLHSMGKIQSGAGGEDGIVGLSPTDQVLWSWHLLETSLMGTGPPQVGQSLGLADLPEHQSQRLDVA